ncbi:MAG: hypothetical protein WDN67_01925 [Candidatus Moraniibacteriota bacterium]
MDKTLIQNQIAEIEKGLRDGDLNKEGAKIWIILEYLHSLLKPEKYSEQQLEDLRRLKLELGFDETVGFGEWSKKNEKP